MPASSEQKTRAHSRVKMKGTSERCNSTYTFIAGKDTPAHDSVMGHFEFMFIIEASVCVTLALGCRAKVPDLGIPRAPSRPDARE